MKPIEYTVRLERKDEQRAVEHLIRESFWNVYRPGATEHYVMHVLRDDAAFVEALNLVMEKDGALIGQVAFMENALLLDDGRVRPVLTLGPVCILPTHQGKGYGKALLDTALERASALGYGAVCLEGNPAFYGNSSFVPATPLGLRYDGDEDGMMTPYFLCKELIPGYLKDAHGLYKVPMAYFVTDDEVEAFDLCFPTKEKKRLAGQLLS